MRKKKRECSVSEAFLMFKKWCTRMESNHHAIAGTRTWILRVYQFHHGCDFIGWNESLSLKLSSSANLLHILVNDAFRSVFVAKDIDFTKHS